MYVYSIVQYMLSDHVTACLVQDSSGHLVRKCADCVGPTANVLQSNCTQSHTCTSILCLYSDYHISDRVPAEQQGHYHLSSLHHSVVGLIEGDID